MAQKLKVIPLGGLLEVGKNITVIELGSDMIIIDVGVAFPDDDMFGIDLVIPDFSYIVANRKKVKGIFLTHGHEDHIGAIAYLLNEISAPVYATRLTAALVEHKLSENKPANPVDIREVEPGDSVDAGCFNVEFINVNHSIADSCALAITTPHGVLIHTGDFKIDTMPVAGEMIDLTRLGQLGKEGVALLMSDSTNAERGGMAMSESKVGERLREIFKDSSKRIIVASFASNVHRMQQVMNAAVEANRKIAVSGRSMENILGIGLDLGYIDIPHDALIDISEVKNYPRKKVCIITTGSQGEEMSALYRMAFDTHKQVKIGEGDLVILSANPIPGNEKPVYRLVNELFRKGAEVVYERLAEVHVSGHACREELKLMLALTKPQNFLPVHGEYRHLAAHAELAKAMGIPEDNVFISEIGRILEISKDGTARLGGTVPSGKILVDGLGVGDVGSVVLRDRKHLSQDGIIIVSFALDEMDGSIISGPEIVTRGFIYAKDAEELIVQMKEVAIDAVDDCRRTGTTDWMTVRAEIRAQLAAFVTKQTKRSPMILPILLEVNW